MQIFNTLTRQKEEFVPQKEGEYRIYVCGPTPQGGCPSYLHTPLSDLLYRKTRAIASRARVC